MEFAAGQRDQASLLLCFELAVVLWVRGTPVEGCLQTILDLVLAHSSGDGRLAHLHSLCYLLIDPEPGPTLLWSALGRMRA